MKIVVLAMLLSVIQASSPIPWKTADNPAATSSNVQDQTKSENKPANPSPTFVNQNQPAPTNTNRDDQRDKNANHSVRISELPPVTVLPAKRDWVDRGYWAFNGLLVIAAGFQIWLLSKTLKMTAKQTKIAGNQELQMAEAGQQTERIIAQMKDTAQRQLRAYMGVSKVFLNLAVPTLPVGSVEIKNFGKTPAYKVRQWIGIAIGPYPLTSPLQKSPQIQASVVVVSPGVKYASIVPLKKSLPTTVVIGTLETTIYVHGGVIYEDAFGKERHTEYRFIYGGPELVTNTRNSEGILLGIMKPDVSGNEAD